MHDCVRVGIKYLKAWDFKGANTRRRSEAIDAQEVDCAHSQVLCVRGKAAWPLGDAGGF